MVDNHPSARVKPEGEGVVINRKSRGYRAIIIILKKKKTSGTAQVWILLLTHGCYPRYKASQDIYYSNVDSHLDLDTVSCPTSCGCGLALAKMCEQGNRF